MTDLYKEQCRVVQRRGKYQRLVVAIKTFEDFMADPKAGAYAEALDQMSKLKDEMLAASQTP